MMNIMIMINEDISNSSKLILLSINKHVYNPRLGHNLYDHSILDLFKTNMILLKWKLNFNRNVITRSIREMLINDRICN